MCGIMVSVDVYPQEQFKKEFEKMQRRGPDKTVIRSWGKAILGFHRLAIMGLTDCGMQPFTLGDWALVCNGEIYNYLELAKRIPEDEFQSGSDCEILLPLLDKFGTSAFHMLEAEFALVAYDKQHDRILACRDEIGIRPLFYGLKNGKIAFASEAKALTSVCDEVHPFPPGHYYDNGIWVDYRKPIETKLHTVEEATKQIHDALVAAVRQRLMADVKVGFLLSGGLDSSLVCALGARMVDAPITTFAIGMDTDAIDLKYARDVADRIGSDHHEVKMTMDQVFHVLEEVIQCLETYDTTTIRASLGMYLLCQYIREKTDIKVVLTGEVSDELFGYKYTDFAPSPEAFQLESLKRVKELYMYDVLRADRCISSWGLEGRVPFAAGNFVNHVLSIDPALKMNMNGTGKYLLRKAFEKDALLPDHILWRQKAAFSDAVGHSMVEHLIARANELYPNFTFDQAKKKYPQNPPLTAEAYWYRELFTKYYPQKDDLIVSYWMPNQDWLDEPVTDPSARVLKNYDQSGL